MDQISGYVIKLAAKSVQSKYDGMIDDLKDKIDCIKKQVGETRNNIYKKFIDFSPKLTPYQNTQIAYGKAIDHAKTTIDGNLKDAGELVDLAFALTSDYSKTDLNSIGGSTLKSIHEAYELVMNAVKNNVPKATDCADKVAPKILYLSSNTFVSFIKSVDAQREISFKDIKHSIDESNQIFDVKYEKFMSCLKAYEIEWCLNRVSIGVELIIKT